MLRDTYPNILLFWVIYVTPSLKLDLLRRTKALYSYELLACIIGASISYYSQFCMTKRKKENHVRTLSTRLLLVMSVRIGAFLSGGGPQ